MRIWFMDDDPEAPVGRDGPGEDADDDEGTGRDGPDDETPDTRGDE